MHFRGLRSMSRRAAFAAAAAVMAMGFVAAVAAPADASPSAASAVGSDSGTTVPVIPDAESAASLPSAQQAELAALSSSSAAIEEATANGEFDYALAVRSGADETVAREWAQGVQLAGGAVRNAPNPTSLTQMPVRIAALAACRGQNRIWTDYLGGHARFSSCVVPKAVAALQAGVGATALAATIATAASMGVAAVSAIVPALLQYSVWSIDACSKNGTGVELAFAGFVCWAQ